MTTSKDRKILRAERDAEAVEQAHYGWVKRYRRHPERWLDLEETVAASIKLGDINPNRWRSNPDLRDLIYTARDAAAELSRAMAEEVYR